MISLKAYRSDMPESRHPDRAAKAKFVEAFEICEYGHKPKMEELKTLFPFFNAETEGSLAASQGHQCRVGLMTRWPGTRRLDT